MEMAKIGALALEHARVLETESVSGAKHFEEALISALTVEDAMRDLMAGTCLCVCVRVCVCVWFVCVGL